MPAILPSLIVYVPLMHSALLPPGLPGGLSVLWPGLPASSRSFPRDGRVAAWRPPMPYSPAEAAACLAALEALGRDMLRGTPVHAAGAARPTAGSGLASGEALALSRFVGQGGPASVSTSLASPVAAGAGNSAPCDTENAQRRAQRLLLLAWLQEERVWDMNGLWSRYHAGAAALAGAFCEARGGDDSAEPESSFSEPATGAARADSAGRGDFEDVRALLPPWRFVLEQMAHFLPGDAALFTADSRLLQEATLASAPTAEEESAAWSGLDEWNERNGWDESVRRRLRIGRAPLWRLLGLPGPQEGKPWLDPVRLVIMFHQNEK